MFGRVYPIIIWMSMNANTVNAMFVAQKVVRSSSARIVTIGASTCIGVAATWASCKEQEHDVRKMLKEDYPDFKAYFAYAKTHNFNPNTQIDDEYIPLIIAASSDNLEALVTLIEDGGDVNVQDLHGATALHWAVYRDNLPLVERLLNERNLDVNLANHEGITPLMAAAHNFSFSHHKNTQEIIDALLAHPQIDVNKKKSEDSLDCLLNRIINPIFPFRRDDIELDRRKRALTFLLERNDLDISVVEYHSRWFREEFEDVFACHNARSKE